MNQPEIRSIPGVITQEFRDRIMWTVMDRFLNRDSPGEMDSDHDPLGRGRIIRYGYDYGRAMRFICNLPVEIQEVADKISMILGCHKFDSASVNEYTKGQAIAPHIDSMDFGPTIAILTLSGNGTLRFRRGDKFHDVAMEPLSLVAFSGDMRTKWTHQTLPAKETRYSIVFRKRNQ